MNVVIIKCGGYQISQLDTEHRPPWGEILSITLTKGSWLQFPMITVYYC